MADGRKEYKILEKGNAMRLATYFDEGPRIGLVSDDKIWDLRRVVAQYLFETERLPDSREIAERMVPYDMALLIRLSHNNNTRFFEDAVAFMAQGHARFADAKSFSKPVESVKLLPPVLRPSKIICCGSAYRDYVIELGRTPSHPRWPTDVKMSFLKQPSALIGHRETIHYPPDSHQLDFENELAIVIGGYCSDISESEASKYIFGYAVFNDACVRDLPSWTGGMESPRGKSVDTLAPCGPWIKTAASLRNNPNDLDFTTKVDGELRQSGNTSGLLWPIERIVAIAARYFRLSPGDIIATGSTKGNALSDGRYLKPGQKIVCEFEEIGVLENTAGLRDWKGEIVPRQPETETT